jgi:hypothetical protein
MSSKTYVGVTTSPRYVIRTQNRGRTYYYFRRRPFPIVRLPGEPGSVLFTDTYTAALRATNLEEFTALRNYMQRTEHACLIHRAHKRCGCGPIGSRSRWSRRRCWQSGSVSASMKSRAIVRLCPKNPKNEVWPNLKHLMYFDHIFNCL